MGKSKSELSKLQTSGTELENKKSDPTKSLSLIQNIMGDILLWDKCIDNITKHKQANVCFQTRIVNAGVQVVFKLTIQVMANIFLRRRIKSVHSIEEARRERDELKTIRRDTESLQSSVNAENEKMYNARWELNALHEEQLKMRADVQGVKRLKEKQETLFSKEVLLGKSL